MLIKRLFPYAALFFLLQTTLRLSLLGRAWLDVEFSHRDIGSILAIGLWFDIVAASFCLLPIALYHSLLPAKLHGGALDKKTDATLRFIFSFAILFDCVAEHLFWTEFTTRFNFIAVDYLVYTQEVIGNIMESYPLYWLLTAIAIIAILLSWASLRCRSYTPKNKPHFTRRFAQLAMMLVLCGVFYTISDADQAEFKTNTEATEVASNGIYNLFHAFWNNEISYDRFYASESHAEIVKNARNLLWEKDSTFLHEEGNDLTRIIKRDGPEQHKNVILVVMESMSADYMGVFGNDEQLTPNLDALTKEGLFFSQTYATGTRTVRGLEAVTLSVPPTPGQSIVRRPNNDNLFSLGFVFKDRGYDTRFIYGGYGYFDNMNNFFAGNGFDIIDRTAMQKDEIQFANVWGVCDEDMFARAIKEADASYAARKPFMHLIMTTSNHRPYTYPEGKIDLPSHSGRLGGVKYADFSVGKLLEQAKTKPWFNDTIFIFVADHTAGAGGKAELDPHKYHIPMIFYAPELIKPQRYEKIASQIDLAPVLLGLMNFSYYTKFYGEDLLNDPDEVPHAFISNYQKVALVKDDSLTILSPKQKIDQLSWPAMENKTDAQQPLINDAITYYQSASWWREQYQRIPTMVAPQ